MPVRLFALVAPVAPDRPLKTRHSWGLPPELTEGRDERVLMPWARVLVLEEGSEGGEGAMLYRYGGDDFETFCGDTWAESVDQAKAQAKFEYEELVGAWQLVPEDVEDATSYAIQSARATDAEPRCPVCGYVLAEPAWTDGVSGSFEICESCGVQFGYTDAAGGDPVRRLDVWRQWRADWISEGMPWRGSNPVPKDFDPLEQLTHVAGNPASRGTQ